MGLNVESEYWNPQKACHLHKTCLRTNFGGDATKVCGSGPYPDLSGSENSGSGASLIVVSVVDGTVHRVKNQVVQ